MKKKILIAHGWMHSADTYKKLKADLEKTGRYEVTLYEFPGFGDSPAEKHFQVMKYYTQKLEMELAREAYDYVIGHSMGGNILLRAMADKDMDTRLILLSPEYNGIAVLKPVILFIPVVPLVLLLLKKVSCSFSTFLIKCMALFTINSWNHINDQIVLDTRKASPVVAACTMLELAWDGWRIGKDQWRCGKVSLILGEKDRIISRKKMKCLCDDLGVCQVYGIRKIGHTAVLEAYDRLFHTLMKILN